jgi:hypothetical protein
MTVTAIAATRDTNASLMVRVNNGVFVPAVCGAVTSPLALTARLNVIELQVVAPDGSGTNTYSVAVTRSIASAVITQIMPQADRTCLLHFNGAPGVIYTIQVSTNLTSWKPLANITAGTSGTFSYLDLAATNSLDRFYRLLCP